MNKKRVELPIEFGALRDQHIEQPKLFGTFAHGQLVAARLADGSRDWKRLPGETAEEMERRVIYDIRLAALDARL